MNKAFEKILEKLEELQNNPLSQTEGDINLQAGVINGVMYSKKIVQEVAEEYNGGWIPVSERLPEENYAVLVWCPERKNIYCAYLEEGQWWIFGAYFEKVKLEVIAWMPLPEPFKERD